MVKKRKHEMVVDYFLQPDDVKDNPTNLSISKHIHYTNPLSGSAKSSMRTHTTYVRNPRSRSSSPPPDARTSGDVPEVIGPHIESIDTEYLSYLAELDVEGTSSNRVHSDNPLYAWTQYQDDFLQELIRSEGRGDFVHNTCWTCSSEGTLFRCQDCLGKDLYCKACTIDRHIENPCHRIQEWTGIWFRRVQLRDLGLRIQLGHPTGELCCNPKPLPKDDFTLLDTNGIHLVALDYCGCETAQLPHIQLLRNFWFGASVIHPKTAATFRLLNHFHFLNFESKVSAFEFYRAISRETDNTHLSEPKMRYESFLRMVREWRFLKMMKRSGRGHDPGGISSTVPGECAVLCPACPQPGKNMPTDWQDSPPSRWWLYRLFLGIDANFRLQHGAISNTKPDPGLLNGCTYFVAEKPYKDFLNTYSNTFQERSTCSSHNAVNNANIVGSRGVDASGVGTVDCARHMMKRACSVGDLQKGERYINMDYIFFTGLRQADSRYLVVSYDIACQWYKNLSARMTTYPSEVHINQPMDVKFLVLKFHLPAHIERCRISFSFNFEVGVGRTDGEAPERGWANTNRLASSTKEMGHGARHDTLDDHFGDWNWKRVVMLGETLLKKIKQALDNEKEALRVLREFEESLDDGSGTLQNWKEEVQAWECTKSGENPYSLRVSHFNIPNVRLELAEEEAQLSAQERAVQHDQVSPGVWIAAGLDIEDQQRRLAEDRKALGLHATPLQCAKLLERANSLQRKIDLWCSVQTIYLPAANILRARPDPSAATAIHPEDFQLYLPSGVVATISCDKKLIEYEFRLRIAQAEDALTKLRNALCIRTHLFKSKRRHMRGVAGNTRAQQLLTRQQRKVNASAEKYRLARRALASLASHANQVEWEHRLPELWSEDVKGLQGDDIIPGRARGHLGEGKRKPSWIWTDPGAVKQAGDDPSMHDALRIEWCKARAHAMRWSEEVLLLQEEMRRVLAFMSWQARWWEGRRGLLENLPAAVAEGMDAYAYRQAALRHTLHDRFAKLWDGISALVAEGSRHPDVQYS